MTVCLTIREHQSGFWNFDCAECDDFYGDRLPQDDAIQATLDHFHLYHPHEVMSFMRKELSE